MAKSIKGQSALEYLMTYGWGLLVVMIVGIVMWQMGVFEGKGTTVSFTGFAKIKPQLSGTGLTAGGTFSGTFINGMGSKIILRAVRVKDLEREGILICCSHSAAPLLGSLGACNDGAVDIAGKDAANFNANSLPRIMSGDAFRMQLSPCLIPNASPAENYRIQVEIDYEDTSAKNTIAHTDAGTLRGPFE